MQGTKQIQPRELQHPPFQSSLLLSPSGSVRRVQSPEVNGGEFAHPASHAAEGPEQQIELPAETLPVALQGHGAGHAVEKVPVDPAALAGDVRGRGVVLPQGVGEVRVVVLVGGRGAAVRETGVPLQGRGVDGDVPRCGL